MFRNTIGLVALSLVFAGTAPNCFAMGKRKTPPPAAPATPTPAPVVQQIAPSLIPQIVSGISSAGDGSCTSGNLMASQIVATLETPNQASGTLTANVDMTPIGLSQTATQVSFTANLSATRRTTVSIYTSADEKTFYGLDQTFQNLTPVNVGTILTPVYEDQWISDDGSEVKCGDLNQDYD